MPSGNVSAIIALVYPLSIRSVSTRLFYPLCYFKPRTLRIAETRDKSLIYAENRISILGDSMGAIGSKEMGSIGLFRAYSFLSLASLSSI